MTDIRLCLVGNLKGIHFAFLFGIALWLVPLSSECIHAQGSREVSRSEPAPESVVQFYKSFLTLYLKNHKRINELNTLRSAGAEEEANESASAIQRETNETLEKLRAHIRSVPAEQVRSRVLDSMKKMTKIYSIYIEKIVSDWAPNKQQVLKRRRLNDNQIIRRNPQLASVSLLRRVFLGELVTSVHFIPETRGWFQNRIRNIRNWIGSKKKEFVQLYVRLVSRVEQAMQSGEESETDRQTVVEEVRNEWRSFWQDVGKGSEWQEVRYSVNELNSFFRNRTDRLPGYQSVYREKVKRLQRQIASLQKMRIEKPFLDRANRLKAMLYLSQMLAEQINELNGQESEQATETVSTVMTGLMARNPSELWVAESIDELQRKKQNYLEQTSMESGDLTGFSLDRIRESFDFPIDAIKELSKRLERFGEKGQELGKSLRLLAEYVQEKHVILTDGIDLLNQYHDALRDLEMTGEEDGVSFEQSFRQAHRSTIQTVQERVRRYQERATTVDQNINKLMTIEPEKLVEQESPEQNSQKQEQETN